MANHQGKKIEDLKQLLVDLTRELQLVKLIENLIKLSRPPVGPLQLQGTKKKDPIKNVENIAIRGERDRGCGRDSVMELDAFFEATKTNKKLNPNRNPSIKDAECT